MRRAGGCRTGRRLLLLALLCVAPFGHGAATTVDSLLAAGRLQLDTSVAPVGGIVPGQKLTLTLKIATDRWFSGGTRITLPEVPGLVILQTEQFASNASERRGDQNWVLQSWTLDVYPQRVGTFTVPPITLRLKVNDENDGDVEGAASSPAVTFEVTLPEGLAGVPNWVAAPRFTVSQQFDRDLADLQVGDAFDREILFEASDTMAMMLPDFSAQGFAGLAAYPSPPRLTNSNNRGTARASRRQRISYVAQADGSYQLPAEDYFWWDTARGQLEVVSLEPVLVTVGSGLAQPSQGGWLDTARVTPQRVLLALAAPALLAALLWLARRYFDRAPLAPVVARVKALRHRLRELRKPALPERLNPGSSAGE